MKLKSHLMILFPVLVPLALFWGCGKGGSPVGPASASSVKITIPMTSVQGKLLGASLNTFLYYFSGSGAPVTGSVGPITSASLGGSFSFTVNLPSSSYNFVALQLNNSATQQALAIGAAAISSSNAPVTLGPLTKAVYQVNSLAAGYAFGFESDATTFVGSDTPTSAPGWDVVSNQDGTGYELDNPALTGSTIAYMGNGNFVDFLQLPPSSSFQTSSSLSKGLVVNGKASAPIPLAVGDVYCVKMSGGGYAWLQITNGSVGITASAVLASSGPSFVFRVNTTLPYCGYEQTKADQAPVYGTTIYNLDGADRYDVAVLGPANGPATSIYVPDPGGDGEGDVEMIDVPTTTVYSLDDAADVSLNTPIGLAIDSSGTTLFVIDPALGPSCQVFTIGAGYEGYNRTAQVTDHFDEPRYVTGNSSGDIFVTDAGEASISGGILEYPPPFSNETTVLTAWNGLFDSPAPASTGIGQVASYGTTVIVADAENNQIEFYSGSSTIPFVSTNPAYSVLTSDNNPAGAVAFNNPQGVAVDPTGMLYISDTSNNRIVLMSVSGVFNTILGPLVDSSLPDPNLSGNTGIKVDNASPPNIYVADTVNNRIVVFQPSGSGSNLVPAPTVGPAP